MQRRQIIMNPLHHWNSLKRYQKKTINYGKTLRRYCNVLTLLLMMSISTCCRRLITVNVYSLRLADYKWRITDFKMRYRKWYTHFNFITDTYNKLKTHQFPCIAAFTVCVQLNKSCVLKITQIFGYLLTNFVILCRPYNLSGHVTVYMIWSSLFPHSCLQQLINPKGTLHFSMRKNSKSWEVN